MALATEKMLRDMFAHGVGIQMITENALSYISPRDFFVFPEPGERQWRPNVIDFREPYDDGGGAAKAAYVYGRCPFA